MDIKDKLIEKINTKTKPVGALGKLEQTALKIGLIQQTLTPELRRPAIIVFAGDHGIADEGISPSPKEITHQMVLNFVGGGAAINVFSRQHGIALSIVDSGVDFEFDPALPILNRKIARGTRNMLHEPAMTVDECRKAMQAGADLVSKEAGKGTNIIGFGEMGIGNSSAAALLLHRYTGHPLDECVGRGTGHDAAGVARKLEILTRVAQRYPVLPPLETLATFGGFEIAMMTGAVLEAYHRNMIIVADGFIATSAFMAAYEMEPRVLDNILFSHTSNEKGHRLMLEHLHGDPLLQLELRLGEGTGVALAYPLIQSAVAFLNEMSGFAEASVTQVY